MEGIDRRSEFFLQISYEKLVGKDEVDGGLTEVDEVDSMCDKAILDSFVRFRKDYRSGLNEAEMMRKCSRTMLRRTPTRHWRQDRRT